VAEPLIELAPELEPVAEASAAGLTQIGAVAIIVVVLGMVLAIDAIVRGFFGTVKGTVGWIPYLGKVIESPIHRIEQKVVSFLSGIAHDLQADVAHHVHVLALDVRRAIHSVEDIVTAVMLLSLLAVAATAHYVIPSIKRLIHIVVKKVEALDHYVTHRITKIERVTKTVFVHQVFPKLRVIEHRVEDLLRHDIREIRAEAKQAERLAIKAEKQVRALNHLVSKKAIAAAVAAALAGAGLEALRCIDFGNLFKKRGCGLWRLLDDLLGLVASTLLLTDVCSFLPLLEAAFGEVAGPLIHLLNEVPLGGCEKPPGIWPQLNVAAGPLPPAQTLGQTLAA
jgi:hypothetical protein